MHKPSFGGTDGELVGPGDDLPYPSVSEAAGRSPCSAGPMAKSDIVLSSPTGTEAAR
jgi:hypothetical protein